MSAHTNEKPSVEVAYCGYDGEDCDLCSDKVKGDIGGWWGWYSPPPCEVGWAGDGSCDDACNAAVVVAMNSPPNA